MTNGYEDNEDDTYPTPQMYAGLDNGWAHAADPLDDLGPVNSAPLHPMFKGYILDTLRSQVGQMQADLSENMTENQIVAAGLGLAESLVATLLLMRVQKGHLSFGEMGEDGNRAFHPRGSALKAQEAHLLTANQALKRAQRLFLQPDQADLKPAGRLPQGLGAQGYELQAGETAATFGLKQISSVFTPLMEQMQQREDTKARISALRALMDSYAQMMINAADPDERYQYQTKYDAAEKEMKALAFPLTRAPTAAADTKVVLSPS